MCHHRVNVQRVSLALQIPGAKQSIHELPLSCGSCLFSALFLRLHLSEQLSRLRFTPVLTSQHKATRHWTSLHHLHPFASVENASFCKSVDSPLREDASLCWFGLRLVSYGLLVFLVCLRLFHTICFYFGLEAGDQLNGLQQLWMVQLCIRGVPPSFPQVGMALHMLTLFLNETAVLSSVVLNVKGTP